MLEYIVRPFQSNPVITNQRSAVTTAVKVTPKKVQLVWGAAGQAPTVTALTVVIKPEKNEYKEKSRKTTDVKIMNPDDPTDPSFVIAQRVNEITFTKKAPPPSGQGTNNSGTSGGVDPNTALKSPPPVETATASPTVNPGPMASAGNPPDEQHHFTLDQTQPV